MRHPHIQRRNTRRCARRLDGDPGAVLVEAVFIFPILLMLVFGMVTYGIALSQGNAIENAAREASRFGSTRPVPGNVKTWLDEVTNVAVAASTGEMDASTPDRYICVALVGAETVGKKETNGTTDTYYSSGSCPETSCPTSDPCVQVAMGRSAKLEGVVFQRTITLEARSVTTYERDE